MSNSDKLSSLSQVSKEEKLFWESLHAAVIIQLRKKETQQLTSGVNICKIGILKMTQNNSRLFFPVNEHDISCIETEKS